MSSNLGGISQAVCGIVAILNRTEAVRQDRIVAATHALRQRGLDDMATWSNSGGHLALGHTRLSIIDLESGRQPLHNEDGRIHAVVNGEFYGFEAIRADLQSRGHHFKTQSDSEIVLHLYEEYGEQCVDHLRGEFAWVIWDENRQLLLAARDRFGIKPLFYSEHDGELLLASEAKALFAAGVPARWDESSVYQNLLVCLDSDQTLFDGVQQVPPGHLLRSTRLGVSLHRYWDLDYPDSQPVSPLSEAEAIERVREELHEAVRLRMRADVPVGCFLSGGLDSAALLGMAADQGASNLAAYTVEFEHDAYNEADLARESADFNGARFHRIRITQQDLADHFSDAVYHGEALGHNAHGVARYLQAKSVHDAGTKVVLSGEGADEVFAGYLYSRFDSLRGAPSGDATALEQRQRLARDNATFRALLQADHEINELRGVSGNGEFVPTWLKATALERRWFGGLMSDDFAERFSNRDPYRFFLDNLAGPSADSGKGPILDGLESWTRSMLPGYILCSDRMEMAHSVEVRVPYLDHVLFEAVRELPGNFLISDLTEKHVLRKAVQPYVSESVAQRKKRPFSAPPATLSSTDPIRQLMEDTFRSEVLSSVPFFDQAMIVGLMDQLDVMSPRQQLAVDPALTLVLSACLLQERYRL